MIMKLTKSILTFITFLVFCKVTPAQSNAQVNGFIIKDSTMCRFSFDNPGDLHEKKITGAWYVRTVIMANRPWMLHIQKLRHEIYAIGTLDTSTGNAINYEIFTLLSTRDLICYDNTTNSICYFAEQPSAEHNHWALYRMSLSDFKSKITSKDDIINDIYSLAAKDGAAYIINGTGMLIKVDMSSGKKSIIGKTRLDGTEITGSDFNPKNGRLYVLLYTNGYTELRAIDVETCKSERITSWDGKYRNLIFSGNVYPPPILAPKPISPEGFLPDIYPLISWEPVPGAKKYFLCIMNREPGSEIYSFFTGYVEGTSYQTSKESFNIGTDMYPFRWRVAAVDDNGEPGTFSEQKVYSHYPDYVEYTLEGTGGRVHLFPKNLFPESEHYDKANNTVESSALFIDFDSNSVAAGLFDANFKVYCGKRKIEFTSGNYFFPDLTFIHLDDRLGMKDVTPGSDLEVIYNYYCSEK